MTTKKEITDAQRKIPEPWLPEHFLDNSDNLPEVLEELASQLTVVNDFYMLIRLTHTNAESH